MLTCRSLVAAFAGRRFPLRAYGGVWAAALRWGRLTHARVLGVLKNPCGDHPHRGDSFSAAQSQFDADRRRNSASQGAAGRRGAAGGTHASCLARDRADRAAGGLLRVALDRLSEHETASGDKEFVRRRHG
jgi:hypothetical protein